MRLIYDSKSALAPDSNNNNSCTTSGNINRIALVCIGDDPTATTTTTATAETDSSNTATTSTTAKHERNIFVQQYASEHATEQAFVSQKVQSSVSAAMTALIKDDEDATNRILVDDFTNHRFHVSQALQSSIFKFDVLKNVKEMSDEKQQQKRSKRYQFVDLVSSSTPQQATTGQQELQPEHIQAFVQGAVYGECQNFARFLGEMPANYMTPTIFCQTVSEAVKSLDGVTAEVHDFEWAQAKQMGSFLSVAKGSAQEPKVLELTYVGKPTTTTTTETGDSSSNGSHQIDLCLVGKGITFDSGGISLKPGAGMKDMRGDMGGAATTCSAFYGIAKLRLPINVKVICMMCENMPGPDSVKPGDVIQAMNKVTIEVDNTDAEGRLILADGLCYASEMKPRMLVDVATLTGAIVVALGSACTGVYTTSNEAWRQIERAGLVTNDYMWRMPLFIDTYKKQLKSTTADLNNVGGREAGSCTAATFLSSFVDFDKVQHWAHLDIAGTFMEKDGMTGRPCKALIQLAQQLSSSTK